MDFYIRELILDKKTTAVKLADVLLEYDPETINPVLEIIDNEIGDEFDDENLDIFDWMNDTNRNYNMLHSLLFQEEWWIIHKKLRRMVRKYKIREQNEQLEDKKKKQLPKLEGWQSLESFIRYRLEEKHIDEKIAIANAISGSMIQTSGLTFYPAFTSQRRRIKK